MKELKNKIIQVLDRMEQNIPAHVIPIQSEDLHYQVARIYGDLDEKEAMRSILEDLVSRPTGRPLNRVEYANTFYKELSDYNKSLQILIDGDSLVSLVFDLNENPNILNFFSDKFPYNFSTIILEILFFCHSLINITLSQ